MPTCTGSSFILSHEIRTLYFPFGSFFMKREKGDGMEEERELIDRNEAVAILEKLIEARK